MTWNAQPNREDVRLGSGLRGYEYNCIRGLPKELAKSESGTGSVTTSQSGAFVDAGDTAGDYAGVEGYYAPYIADGLQKFRYSRTVLSQRPSDYTGGTRVGITNSDSTAQEGAFVDLKNTNAVVGGNTVGISHDGTRRTTSVDIRVDFESGTTDFRVEGAFSGEAHFNTVPSLNESTDLSYHVFIESGGAGGNFMDLIFGRDEWYL